MGFIGFSLKDANTMEKITLTKECETLFIPLYCKALMSKDGTILTDKKAEDIVRKVDYDFSTIKASKSLQIYMAIRASIIDDYADDFLTRYPDAVVLHLGCGLDSRVERVSRKPAMWYDIDFPAVIAARKLFFDDHDKYRQVPVSVAEKDWMTKVDAKAAKALIIAEGLTMFLTEEENKALFLEFKKSFEYSEFIFDAYSVSSMRMSKYRNPVNKMGATIRWGLDDPRIVENFAAGISHRMTKYFTEPDKINQLAGIYKIVFKAIKSISWANNLYRIYAFVIEK
jgi:O-methyltransferase involved in polyketide biosynthesis